MPEAVRAPTQIDSSERRPADDTAALTRAVARGDAAAFGVLYERWFDRTLGAAQRLTGRDEAFCLDVTQEAMLKAARRVPHLESEAALSRWLCRVVHRAALDALRRERRARAREARRRSPDENRRDDDRIAWLATRLVELSAADRSLIGARFFRARSLEQVGEELGVSGDTAHGRLRRLISRLREASKDEP